MAAAAPNHEMTPLNILTVMELPLQKYRADVWARTDSKSRKKPGRFCATGRARPVAPQQDRHAATVAFTVPDKDETLSAGAPAMRGGKTDWDRATQLQPRLKKENTMRISAKMALGCVLAAAIGLPTSGAGRRLVCLVAQARQAAILRPEPAGDASESRAGQTQGPGALERTGHPAPTAMTPDGFRRRPGDKTPVQYYGDDRVFWVVWGGQIRFNIQGQQPFVATKGFLVQVPQRVRYSMETVGSEPSLRFESHPCRHQAQLSRRQWRAPAAGSQGQLHQDQHADPARQV